MNWLTAGIVAILITVATVAACAAFDSGDIVRSKTPVEVQESKDLPPRMSHNDSMSAYLRWQRDQLAIDEAWGNELEKSGKWVAFIDGFTYEAWQQFSPFLASAGPIGTIGAFLGGWLFVRRPSDATAKQLSAEKQASFNEADKRGRELAADIAKAAKIDTSVGWAELQEKLVN